MYKLILSQFLVLKCYRSCSAGEKLIFLLHCSALQVHCSAMPFPPWFRPFISSSIEGTTQFLFEKADNFVKYTGIEIYHTATWPVWSEGYMAKSFKAWCPEPAGQEPPI